MEFKEFINSENLDFVLEDVSLDQLMQWEKEYPLFDGISLLILRKKKAIGQSIRDQKFEQRAWSISHREQLADLIFDRHNKMSFVKEAISPIIATDPSVAEIVKKELEEMRDVKRELLSPLLPIEDRKSKESSKEEVKQDLRVERELLNEYDEEEIRSNITKLLEDETQKLSKDAQELREKLADVSRIGEESSDFKKITEGSEELQSLKDKIKAYTKRRHLSDLDKDKNDMAVKARLNPIHSKKDNIQQIQDFIDAYRKEGHDVSDRQRSIDEMVAKSIDNESIPVSEALANLFAEQGHTQKAVEVYRSLGLIYPDKISYFARQIVNLNNR